MYDRIATKIIQIELDASGGDIESFIKRWRGADPEGDYLKRFYAELA